MAKKVSKSLLSFVVIACILLGTACGVIANIFLAEKPNDQLPSALSIGAISGLDVTAINEQDLSIHFLELGNKYNGDCIYIKAGDTDILVDAGSRANSVPTIQAYVNQFCKDNVLEFVIATHADRDHIAGFATKNGIFALYDVETIIDFPKSDKTTTTYNNYKKYRDEENAKHYTALECYKNQGEAKSVYQLADNIELEILYNYYYENNSPDENNYSVCFMITKTVGEEEKRFLFTGDLEKEGEEKFAEHYASSNIFDDGVELYKAGHHGSKTSSNLVLLDLIKPKTCVACCVAGSTEFTDNPLNTFPTQTFIENIAKHTSDVYITSMAITENDEYAPLNGNVVYCYTNEKTIYCSANSAVLKDTEWFINACQKGDRTCPTEWLN